MIQQMLAIWCLVPLPFLNPPCTSGSSWFTYCWSLAQKIFERNLASMWNESNCSVVWTFFGFAVIWNYNENCPFPVLWLLLNFPNLLTYWVQHFHSRTWNNSTGIPSPPLGLFVVMLPKAQWTSHPRMSGSRWVITPSWLTGSWRIFWIVLLCILGTSF